MKNNIYAALIITLLTGFIFSVTVQADTVQTRTFTQGGTTTQIIKTYFDSAGLMTRQDTDTNGDGTTDRVTTYTYSSGRLTSTEFKTYGTNILLNGVYNTYDSSGRSLSISQDVDGDSTIDSIQTYSYSGEGNKDYTLTIVERGITKVVTSGSVVQ
jgi:hypothetical protein